MLSAQVIGVGAAGNKAAFELVKSEVIRIEDALLVNSTLKDIPTEYKDHRELVVQIGNSSFDGCGKEREEGKNLALEAIQNKKLNIDSFVKPTTNFVIILSSTEGGTGSGASIVIAKYLKTVMHVDVKIYAFTGFEEDPRGLRNTVEFFKDLRSDYSVHVIRNKKFLPIVNNNFAKAEIAANKELSIQISVLLGHAIMPSDTNMDDTDLKKVSANYGYTDVLYREIDDKLRGVEDFNRIIRSMIDNSKGMDINNPTQTLMGIIINLPESERDSIDYSWTEVINHYGEPFERFRHIQYDDEKKRFFAIITTGMELPIEEIQLVYDRYKERKNKINKNRKDFDSAFEGLDMDDEDNAFNFRNKNKDVDAKPSEKDRSEFFNSFNVETPNVPKNNSSNKIIKSNNKDTMSGY